MMTDETARPHHHIRGLSKQHWKGKIFSNDEALEKEVNEKLRLNQDVADFLRPSVKPLHSPPRAPPAHHIGRIDTSSARRWPRASEINQKIADFRAAASLESTARGKATGPKRSKKGLTVHFTDAEPEIIGEGGDEAAVPPSEVSRSWDKPQTSSQSQADIKQGTARPGGEDKSTRRGPELVSQTTNPPLSSLDGAKQPATVEGRSHFVEESVGSVVDTPARARDLANDYITLIGTENEGVAAHSRRAESQAVMRAEEGKALHHRYSHSSTEEGDDPSSETTTLPWVPLDQRSIFPDNQVAWSDSHQHPVPPPYQLFRNQSADVSLIRTPQNGSEVVTGQPRPHHTPDLLHPGPVRSPALASWHFAASALQENATECFSSRIQHLGRVFHLAADKFKPMSETSVGEWIRAAVWWFIKGRGELEKAIRNSPKVADGSKRDVEAVRRSKQPFVDLAKAWWIVQEVVPQHPEVRRYGDFDLGLLANVAKNHGDERLADLIEVHQQICSKFGALAMSMQRNGFLPTDADQPLLSQGLSTSIWVPYPLLTPEVCATLSGNAARSLLVQPAFRKENLAEFMPLGDTNSHFIHGRMFVEIVLSDHRGESHEVRLACVLSITREQANWEIKMIVASQNELVNISVQSDKQLGQTWDNVLWNIKRAILTIDVAARGFALHVQFKEEDFRTLRRIYDDMQKVKASLKPEADEILVFSKTVKCFQHIDSNSHSLNSAAKPGARCRVSLFEKEVIQIEGSGIRKFIRGHRLVAVTSPKVKMLSSVNRQIGQQQAIEFRLVRGDEGLPGLLLKVRKEETKSNIILTFYEAEERLQFLSVLKSSFVQEQEMVLADVPLRALFIKGGPQEETSARFGRDALKDFGWKQVRIINKDPNDPDRAHGQTVRSDNLRICAEAAFGSVTDRVNLGR